MIVLIPAIARAQDALLFTIKVDSGCVYQIPWSEYNFNGGYFDSTLIHPTDSTVIIDEGKYIVINAGMLDNDRMKKLKTTFLAKGNAQIEIKSSNIVSININSNLMKQYECEIFNDRADSISIKNISGIVELNWIKFEWNNYPSDTAKVDIGWNENVNICYNCAAMKIVSGNIIHNDSVMYFSGAGSIVFKPCKKGNALISIKARSDDSARIAIHADNTLLFDVNSDTMQEFSNETFLEISDSIFITNYSGNVEVDYIYIDYQISDSVKWGNDRPYNYELCWGLKSREYINSITIDTAYCIVEGLPFFSEIFFSIRLLYNDNFKSDYSNEVSCYKVPSIKSYHKGDWDNDGKIDFDDLIQFCMPGIYGATQLNFGYDSIFDFDDSGKIGFEDLVTFCQQYGTIF